MCSLTRMHRCMDELGLKDELRQKMGRGIDSADRGSAGAKASGLSSWGCPEALPGLEHGKAGGDQIGRVSGAASLPALPVPKA